VRFPFSSASFQLTQIGTGGVSILAIKLARLAGAKVILASSSDAKLATFKDSKIGKGQETINYKESLNWDQEVLRLTGGLGADIVLENGGTSSLVRSIRATKRRGVVASVGYLGGVDLEAMRELLDILIDRAVNLKYVDFMFPLMAIGFANARNRGINVGSKKDLEKLYTTMESNRMELKDVIDSTFGFSRVEEAFEHLTSGAHTGKVVITID
jgi:NADPH:quinone reductase-like Zn-dependent oxidoreductase